MEHVYTPSKTEKGPLHPRDVEQARMPCFLGMDYPDDDTCPLCFDNMTRGSIFRRLPCNHLMHKECIDKWLCTQDGSCPFCRETFYHIRKPLVVRKSAFGATAMMYVDDEDDKDQLEMGRAAFMLWLKGLFRRV